MYCNIQQAITYGFQKCANCWKSLLTYGSPACPKSLLVSYASAAADFMRLQPLTAAVPASASTWSYQNPPWVSLGTPVPRSTAAHTAPQHAVLPASAPKLIEAREQFHDKKRETDNWQLGFVWSSHAAGCGLHTHLNIYKVQSVTRIHQQNLRCQEIKFILRKLYVYVIWMRKTEKVFTMVCIYTLIKLQVAM